MTIRKRSLQFGLAITAFLICAPQMNAQVLPRNKDGAKQDAKTVEREVQRTKDGTTVERDVQRTKDGGAVDTQRTRTRVRTDADRTAITGAARTSGTILRSTQIIGALVNVQSDQRVGKVTEIVFNDGGCISYLVVDMDGRLAPIPWQSGNYDYQQKVFLLTDFDQARIARIPTFTTYDQLSDDKFVTQVNTYFNVRGDTRVNSRSDVDVRTNDRSSDRPRSTPTEAKDGAASSKSRTSTEVNKESDKSGAKSENSGKEPAPTTRQPSDSKDAKPSSEKKSNTEKDDPAEAPKR